MHEDCAGLDVRAGGRERRAVPDQHQLLARTGVRQAAPERLATVGDDRRDRVVVDVAAGTSDALDGVRVDRVNVEGEGVHAR